MRTMYYLKGCYDVATSSIIENIRVNNPKALEEYIDAMEYFAKNHRQRSDNEKSGVITDSERTRNFVNKVLTKKKVECEHNSLLSYRKNCVKSDPSVTNCNYFGCGLWPRYGISSIFMKTQEKKS